MQKMWNCKKLYLVDILTRCAKHALMMRWTDQPVWKCHASYKAYGKNWNACGITMDKQNATTGEWLVYNDYMDTHKTGH